MRRSRLLATALAAALGATGAQAAPTQLATGSLPGSFTDLSGLSRPTEDDNAFPDTGFDNPNQWFVFGLADADLDTTSVVQPVPEPSTYAMMFAGLSVLGWVVRRRRI